jgi:excisionase family DNA binding protein
MGGVRREATYTTFQIADICGVRPTTVIKWANQDRIKAYATPGGHRRVLESNLMEFLKKYGFPIPANLFGDHKFRVLIVEDEVAIASLLTRGLQRAHEKIEVQWAKDGVEGLLAVGQTLPDLILLDVEIPLVDGSRVLANLKSDPQTKAIRVVGMTGKRLNSEKIKFMQDHTDAFFHKPFDIHGLVEKVMQLLGVPVINKSLR